MRTGILLTWFFLACAWAGPAGAEPWPGVDETVVEHYAQQYGREAKDPWINTDQGDLLLFVFALAGAAGGFVAGYNWRKLFGESGGAAQHEYAVPPAGTSHGMKERGKHV